MRKIENPSPRGRHARSVAIVACASFALLLWSGCGASLSERRAGGVACTEDKDCRAGFCDRGLCVELAAGPSNYGGLCDSASSLTTPGQPDPQCGGYLCMEGRCRSCQTDAECTDHFGVGRCGRKMWVWTNWGGGDPCILPTTQERDRDASWTSSLPCANVGPDISIDQRLTVREACIRDCDCKSGFCDRGTCADIADIGAWGYGSSWCPRDAPNASDDHMVISGGLPLGPTEPEYVPCEGYVCVDHRCRSCISDAECQEGNKEYRCLPLYGLPGKSCGRPEEAAAPPARKRSGPTMNERHEMGLRRIHLPKK